MFLLIGYPLQSGLMRIWKAVVSPLADYSVPSRGLFGAAVTAVRDGCAASVGVGQRRLQCVKVVHRQDGPTATRCSSYSGVYLEHSVQTPPAVCGVGFQKQK